MCGLKAPGLFRLEKYDWIFVFDCRTLTWIVWRHRIWRSHFSTL